VQNIVSVDSLTKIMALGNILVGFWYYALHGIRRLDLLKIRVCIICIVII